MAGKRDGKKLAIEAIRSGNAESKMREIIAAQGGNSHIQPEDISISDKHFTVQSDISGNLLWINNSSVASLARFLGSPKDSSAGILLHKKLGDIVNKGEPLFTIYSERSSNLQRAVDRLEEFDIMGVGDKIKMLIHEVRERPVTERSITLDR